MKSLSERWDLSYLYPGFEDESFKNDMKSLQQDAENLRALLKEEAADQAVKLEKLMNAREALDRKLDRLGSFISCTLAVDATNAAANLADDQLMAAYTALSPLYSDITRFVQHMDDLESVIASSQTLQGMAFALREMKDQAGHLVPEELEPWLLEMTLSGGTAFSQLRDKLDSTLTVDYREEKLPLAAVRGKAYDPDPAVRKDAYDAEIASYAKVELPMSYCLNSIKMEARTRAKARNFSSVLDMTLYDSRMDRETLDALWAAVREALPDFRRYLKGRPP